MKAMLFAAGKGTRLQPITNNIPKALVEVGDKTMLEHAILHLRQYGYDEIIINLHHFPEKIKEYLRKKDQFNVKITFSEEYQRLLDTGGGLKKASWFFESDHYFLIRNVDILSNLNLNRLLEYHQKEESLATLVVRERITSRYLLFDNENNLCGWENLKTNEKKLLSGTSQYKKLAFSGIHITCPSIKEYMPEEKQFSILDVYLNAAGKTKIKAYIDRDSYWFDIGNLDNLEKARTFILQNESNNY